MTNVISRDALCLQAQSKTMTTLLPDDLSCMHFRVARFGRAARSYESTAHIQRCLAARLASRCDVSTPRAILELGCGTGLLTRRLRERFPDSLLVASDAAPEMLERACLAVTDEKARFVVQDASGTGSVHPTIAFHAPYDLVVSGALVQWLPDLTLHLRFVEALMASRGTYVLSTFTQENFPELRALLTARSPSHPALPGVDPIVLDALARKDGWSLKMLAESEDQEELPSPRAVLEHLRAMGVSQDPRHAGRLTRATLNWLLRSYSNRFSTPGGVSLTWRSCIAALEKIRSVGAEATSCG
jgi:malonyl-CoA O-methyltransferase